MTGAEQTRVLGLDVGDRRIGTALSDPGRIIASPLSVIQRTDDVRADADTILTLIEQHQVGLVIVGLPYHMDGSLGAQAEKVQAFVRELSTRTKVPVNFRDERLTTVAARRIMQQRRKMTREPDDAVAAAVLLQEYLDEAPPPGD
jgi:putative Holliday junction resolvase